MNLTTTLKLKNKVVVKWIPQNNFGQNVNHFPIKKTYKGQPTFWSRNILVHVDRDFSNIHKHLPKPYSLRFPRNAD